MHANTLFAFITISEYNINYVYGSVSHMQIFTDFTIREYLYKVNIMGKSFMLLYIVKWLSETQC